MLFNEAKKFVGVLATALVMLAGFFVGEPVLAETVAVEHGPFATTLNLPVYQWQGTECSPGVVVLAIHGLTMHGTVFDACARKLATDGAIVVAPDLRGYGAWYKGNKHTHVNYEQSEKDLYALISAIHQRYQGLPIFVMGESLGGSMAIRLAAKHGESLDGLILCAPAIKFRYSVKTMVDSILALARPSHQFDVSNYIRTNFSEDSQITEEGMTDPLIRRQLRMSELVESCRFIGSTRHYISMIPSAMPVLVLQGKDDRIVRPSGVAVLQSALKTTDKTIQLLPRRGHILIETQHVHSDTIETIASWVRSESVKYALRYSSTTQVHGFPHPSLHVSGNTKRRTAGEDARGS